MSDLSKLNFTTAENYLKRSEFCGSALLTLGGYGTASTQTVDHNLGYVPLFDVYAELDTADEIIAGGEKVNSLTEQRALSGLSADPAYPFMRAWATTTQLTIRLENYTSPTASGTRRVYWIIYQDYNNA